MVADPRYVEATEETAAEVAEKLDITERKLSSAMGLDIKKLRSELLRKLRLDEIGEYDHDGLVGDWLYYRAAVTDWAASSSSMPPPTDSKDPQEHLTEAALSGLRRIWVRLMRLPSSISLVHWLLHDGQADSDRIA